MIIKIKSKFALLKIEYEPENKIKFSFHSLNDNDDVNYIGFRDINPDKEHDWHDSFADNIKKAKKYLGDVFGLEFNIPWESKDDVISGKILELIFSYSKESEDDYE